MFLFTILVNIQGGPRAGGLITGPRHVFMPHPRHANVAIVIIPRHDFGTHPRTDEVVAIITWRVKFAEADVGNAAKGDRKGGFGKGGDTKGWPSAPSMF